MKHTCKRCERPFTPRSGKKSTNEFCSRTCSTTYQNKSRDLGTSTRACPTCEEEFDTRNSKPKKYCSANCYRKRKAINGILRTDLPEYWSWFHMKNRLRSNEKYKRLDMDPRWADFEVFLSDMGPHVGKKKSLDRVDNEKGYWPDNCRWVSPCRQGLNRKNNKLLAFRGEVKSMSEWAEIFCVNYRTLQHRVRRGWSTERALLEPAKSNGKCRYITWRGETRSIAEWARESGIPESAIRSRLRLGWPPKEILTKPHTERTKVLEHGGMVLSIREWEKKLGFSKRVVSSRLSRGWTVEEALTTPILRRPKK